VSGHNDAMWMPRFVLPSLDMHLRSVEAGTFLVDIVCWKNVFEFCATAQFSASLCWS
jgi:hypothetical protein